MGNISQLPWIVNGVLIQRNCIVSIFPCESTLNHDSFLVETPNLIPTETKVSSGLVLFIRRSWSIVIEFCKTKENKCHCIRMNYGGPIDRSYQKYKSRSVKFGIRTNKINFKHKWQCFHQMRNIRTVSKRIPIRNKNNI